MIEDTSHSTTTSRPAKRRKRDDGPPKDAIPTQYKGITMRSRFEANVARMFDLLGWPWDYEKHSFLLDNGNHYMPDFHIPDMETWVEVRGYGEAEQDVDLWYFATDLGYDDAGADFYEDMALISSAGLKLWRGTNRYNLPLWREALILECRKCGRYFFGAWDDMTCRWCHYHDKLRNIGAIVNLHVRRSSLFFTPVYPHDQVSLEDLPQLLKDCIRE